MEQELADAKQAIKDAETQALGKLEADKEKLLKQHADAFKVPKDHNLIDDSLHLV